MVTTHFNSLTVASLFHDATRTFKQTLIETLHGWLSGFTLYSIFSAPLFILFLTTTLEVPVTSKAYDIVFVMFESCGRRGFDECI